jgi:quinol monooxygenase YgiN
LLASRFAGKDASATMSAFASPIASISKFCSTISRQMPKRNITYRKENQRSNTHATKLPKSAVTLTVILRAREGQESLLEAELRALVGATRREEGCITYDLHCAAEIPGAFLLHEVWASREHHSRHTKTPHFLRWDAGKDTLLASRDATFWKRLF